MEQLQKAFALRTQSLIQAPTSPSNSQTLPWLETIQLSRLQVITTIPETSKQRKSKISHPQVNKSSLIPMYSGLAIQHGLSRCPLQVCLPQLACRRCFQMERIQVPRFPATSTHLLWSMLPHHSRVSRDIALLLNLLCQPGPHSGPHPKCSRLLSAPRNGQVRPLMQEVCFLVPSKQV